VDEEEERESRMMRAVRRAHALARPDWVEYRMRQDLIAVASVIRKCYCTSYSPKLQLLVSTS